VAVKAISLWQPWASAIANGVKTVETRSWRTEHLGPVAIHAAQKRSGELAAIFDGLMHDHLDILKAFVAAKESCFRYLPFGAVVCTAEIFCVGNVEMFELARFSKVELSLGNYSAGRFLWKLENIKKLPKPVPCIGRQGFFNVEL
jgi:activating signal cointegrator 1